MYVGNDVGPVRMRLYTGRRRDSGTTGRGGVWTVAIAGSLVVVLLGLLVRTSGQAGPPVAETRVPIGDGAVTPFDLPSPPLASGSATHRTSPAASPYSEPPTVPPAPVTPPKRPVPAPAPPAAPRPPTVTSYEAESPGNYLSGTKTYTCYGCSGDRKVGRIGADMGTLQFNGIKATEGPATVTLVYVNGEDTRTALLTTNGVQAGYLSFRGTGGWSTVGTVTIVVRLRAGTNTLRFSNSYSAAPDFDRIVVSVPAR